jgi:uncharacterized protein (TIGR04168 family)
MADGPMKTPDMPIDTSIKTPARSPDGEHSPSITIAVVGDVHDLWNQADGEILQRLGVDLLLLVGDFGNESVEVVRAIAHLDLPKAVILGNHDAWYSASEWGRQKCPYDRSREDRVQQQLDLLGATHVGYSYLDFPQFELSVVGARPFSWGGSDWKNPTFYQRRYGVGNWAESTQRIVSAVEQTAYPTVIFIGHCGPFGLGDRPEDICGKDWNPPGGDHGDPDFASAIAQAQQQGKTIPLVTFGHMHHSLRHRRDRLRQQIIHASNGCLYLNAAWVPRIVATDTGSLHHFSLVQLQQGHVIDAAFVWVDEQGAIAERRSLLAMAQPSIIPSLFEN